MSDVDYRNLVDRMKDLQLLMNKFAEIQRIIYMPDTTKNTDRRETDTEHSYNLAMHAWFISQSLPELNQEKVMKYALAHDIVEIHAGDVMAIGRTDKQQKAKELREADALKQIEAEWPDFKDLTNTIRSYESQNDAESVFVKALDKIMPILHQTLSEGKTWKKLDMNRDTVLKNKDEKTSNSEIIASIWKELRVEILTHPEWFNEGKTE